MHKHVYRFSWLDWLIDWLIEFIDWIHWLIINSLCFYEDGDSEESREDEMHKLIYEEYHSVKHEVEKFCLVIFCPQNLLFWSNPESWIRSEKNGFGWWHCLNNSWFQNKSFQQKTSLIFILKYGKPFSDQFRLVFWEQQGFLTVFSRFFAPWIRMLKNIFYEGKLLFSLVVWCIIVNAFLVLCWKRSVKPDCLQSFYFLQINSTWHCNNTQ